MYYKCNHYYYYSSSSSLTMIEEEKENIYKGLVVKRKIKFKILSQL